MDPDPTGPVLSRAVDEPAGANCSDGGRAVQSGIDRDGNGTLGDAEVETTIYVCRRDRVRLVAEANGQNCRDGGTAVWVGDDANGNDILEQSEVRDIVYVCETIHALLTRVVLDAASAPCAEGAAIDAGLDLDDDGTLRDDEVVVTEYVCGDALVGDVAIKTPADLARVQGVRGVVNAVVITDTALAEVKLPDLAFIGGALVVNDNPMLSVLQLPQLTRIGASYELQRNPVLAEVTPTPFIESALLVRENALLTEFEVASFVRGPIAIENNAVLETIDWDFLATEHEITILENPALTTISLDVSGMTLLSVRDNALLETLFVSGTAVRGEVVVAQNPALTAVDLEVFEIASDLTIRNNAALGSVSFRDSGSTIIRGDLTVADSPIASLGGAGNFLVVGGDTELANLHVEQLSSPANIGFIEGDLSLHDNPSLEEVQTLGTRGRLSVVDNPSLVIASFDYFSHYPALVTVSNNAALEQFLMFRLTSAGSIVIDENPALTLASFSALLSAELISFTNNSSLPVCQITAVFDRITSPTKIQSGNDTDGVCEAP